MDDAVSFIVLYVSPILAYMVVRAFTVRLVLRGMMALAPKPFDSSITATQSADSAALPTEPAIHSVSSAQNIVVEGDATERVQRAMRGGKPLLNAVLLATLFYVVSIGTLLWRKLSPAPADGSAEPVTVVINGGSDFIGAVLSILLSGVAIIATLAVITSLIGAIGDRYDRINRVPVPFAALLCAVFLAGAVAIAKAIGLSRVAVILSALIAVAIIAVSYVRLMKRVALTGNISLLVLRVFNADGNTAHVFGPLMKQWQYLGSFFTIVDPSYVRYQLSLSSGSRWKLLRLITLMGALLTIAKLGGFLLPALIPASSALDPDARNQLISLIMWLIFIPAAVLPVMWSVRRRFAPDTATLDSHIERGMVKRWWNEVFSGAPLFCHDDVWKPAVSRLLGKANVVLMDLRGFSRERVGCEYELGELVDHFPFDRTLFLVSGPDAREGVAEIIKNRWKSMRVDSPNRGLSSPAIRFYTPTPHDKRDVERIVSLLAASAVVGAPAAQLVPAKVLGRYAAWRMKMAIRFEAYRYALTEGLDMAVAEPRYFRVLAPVLLLLVVGSIGWRVRPAITLMHAIEAGVGVAQVTSSDMGNMGSGTQQQGAEIAQPPVELITSTVEADMNCRGEATNGTVAVRLKSEDAVQAIAFRMPDIEMISSSGGIDRSSSAMFTTDQWYTGNEGSGDIPVRTADGVCVPLGFAIPAGPPAKITALSGSVSMKTAGAAMTVTVENVGAKLQGAQQISIAGLEEGGLKGVMHTNETGFEIRIDGSDLDGLDISLRNNAGPVDSNGGGSGPGYLTFHFPQNATALAGARLTIKKEPRKRLHFEVKNVTIHSAEPAPQRVLLRKASPIRRADPKAPRRTGNSG